MCNVKSHWERRCMIFLITLLLVIGGLYSYGIAEENQPETASILVKMASGLTAEQKAEVISQNGGTEISTIPALRIHIVEVQAENLSTVMENYQTDPRVQRVEINKTRQVRGSPSDLSYINQWALPAIGWDLVFGNITPVGTSKVAVLDTGIDANHEELAGKLAGGVSILDGSDGRTDPHGHGTWLAGIVAANTDNSEGIAGISYAGVQIMPVTVLNAEGIGQDGDIIEGIIWAVDNGANVILMGFSNPDYSESLQEAIDYAWSNGIVLVAATGNDASGEPTYPAGHRGVMGVSATDQNDALAGFSNYGTTAFIAAPGVSIETTDINNSYYSVNGTSASSAIVAGVAAFMKAVDPSLSNGVIVGRLARTADPAGTQEQTGNGRVNMAAALADTSMDAIQPVGVAGGGGPYVGPYKIAARNLNLTFAGTGSGSVTITVNKGTVNAPTTCGGTGTAITSQTVTSTCHPNITISENDATVTFSASAGTGAAFTGWSGQSNLSPSTCSGTTNPCTAQLTATANLTVTFLAKQNTSLSVSPASGTYGGTVNLSATLTSGGSVVNNKSINFTLNGVSVGSATTDASGVATLSNVSLGSINAGTYPTGVGASFAGDSSYNSSSGSAQLTVNKATATVTLSNLTQTYTGSPLYPTATTNPAGLTIDWTNAPQTNAGSYSVTATVNDPNYEGSSSGTFVINKASTTTTVTCEAGPFTYNALPHRPCTATVTGPGGLNESLTVNYTDNINAGEVTASANYAGGTNWLPSSGAKNFTIGKASSTTTVTCPASVTYTGSAQTPCGATVTGVGEFSESLTVIYTDNINAGTATASANFAGNDNFLGSSDSKTFTIEKADVTVTVESNPNPSTYGDLVTFTATVTRGETEDPVTEGTVIFILGDDCDDEDRDELTEELPLNEDEMKGKAIYVTSELSATPKDTPHIITACYIAIEDGNYNAGNGSAEQHVGKADATCEVEGWSGTYDGNPHGASGSCTGVKGETLSGLDLGAKFTDVPGGTANWTFTDVTGNYKDRSGSVAIVISKAEATCTVNGWTGTYDGTPHGASGSCTGVGGVDLSSQLNLGETFTNVPGGTANWTFTGGTNYNDQSGSVAIAISKAEATCTVNGWTGTYDGNPHGASGSCTGVKGELLDGLDLGAKFTDVPGGTANWTFTDVTGNYKDRSGSVAIVISKASTTTVILSDTPDPSLIGQLYTVTWQVTVNSPGGGTPTGTVTVTDGSGASCSAAVGAGSCALASMTVGSKTLTATYSGDDNFHGSAGTALHGVNYRFIGFLPPVNNVPTVNTGKAGRTYPIKWQLTDASGNFINTLSAVTSLKYQKILCDAFGSSTTDPLEEVAAPTGGTVLRYDTSSNQYIYNWATPSQGCYTIYLTLSSGQVITAYFNLTK